MVLTIFWTSFGWPLVAATVAMVAIYIVFTQKVTDWRNALRAQMNDLDTGAVAHAVDSLLNFETVKYFGAEEREAKRYDAAISAYAAAATKSENSLAWLNVGQALITNAMLGGGMAYVAWGWSQGRFSAGDVVFVSTLLSQLFRPLDLLGMVYRTIRQGVIDMASMFALIDTPAEVVDAPNAAPLVVDRGRVRFEDVHFGYDADREILKGLDLDIPAGTTLAVVGPSGAGKSTLARLMYRFYDVDAGAITIDGQDVRTVTQASYAPRSASCRRTRCCSTTRSATISATAARRVGGGDCAGRGGCGDRRLHRTPARWLRDARRRARTEAVGRREAARRDRAHAAEEPADPDPGRATSALDSRTEAEILDTLKAIERGRTTIVIAHRLSTVVHADQIVVLDGGRVAERGTHAELLKRGGLYAEMWARQAQERDDEDVAGAGEGALAAE